ncbi:MAG: hypothetical protein SPJ04_06520 [Bdellovibrionota bacterium]|nr:hypothetical protein [Pseudomonadota bacterium]MDY6090890.1 hypothetical protein [Bdellovibrionota bacterium]
MFGKKIQVESSLYEKLKKVTDTMGVSVNEFATKVLENEVDKILGAASSKDASDLSQSEIDAISKKLKGLGYLD